MQSIRCCSGLCFLDIAVLVAICTSELCCFFFYLIFFMGFVICSELTFHLLFSRKILTSWSETWESVIRKFGSIVCRLAVSLLLMILCAYILVCSPTPPSLYLTFLLLTGWPDIWRSWCCWYCFHLWSRYFGCGDKCYPSSCSLRCYFGNYCVTLADFLFFFFSFLFFLCINNHGDQDT